LDIQICTETTSDVASVHQLTRLAFLNAPHTDHTEQFIVDALRNAGVLAVSLVAKARGQNIGHVAVSPVTLSSGTPGWFGLGPISVLPEYQQRGVGSRLMKRAIADLEAMGAAGCVVLGDPGYYGRFGFKVIDGLTFPGVPVEYFQALTFTDNIPRAVVSYHEAFSVQR